MAHLGTKRCFTFRLPESYISVKVDTWGRRSGAYAVRFDSSSPARNALLMGVKTKGELSGSVMEAGVPVPFCVVRCYERGSGSMIAEARTDALGLFSFPAVEKGSDQHYVIALDPDGGATYNALIFDRVIPV